MALNTEIKFEIVQNIGVLSENNKGWKKELNLVKWNGANAKYDIREWAPDHSKMGKGVTLSNDEFDNLKQLINDL